MRGRSTTRSHHQDSPLQRRGRVVRRNRYKLDRRVKQDPAATALILCPDRTAARLRRADVGHRQPRPVRRDVRERSARREAPHPQHPAPGIDALAGFSICDGDRVGARKGRAPRRRRRRACAEGIVSRFMSTCCHLLGGEACWNIVPEPQTSGSRELARAPRRGRRPLES